jgi:hypothetical protein
MAPCASKAIASLSIWRAGHTASLGGQHSLCAVAGIRLTSHFAMARISPPASRTSRKRASYPLRHRNLKSKHCRLQDLSRMATAATHESRERQSSALLLGGRVQKGVIQENGGFGDQNRTLLVSSLSTVCVRLGRLCLFWLHSYTSPRIKNPTTVPFENTQQLNSLFLLHL